MNLVIANIDAGGGAVIDLYYDIDERRIKEEKILADGKVVTTEFEFDEFEPELYGTQGQEFLDKVEILVR